MKKKTVLVGFLLGAWLLSASGCAESGAGRLRPNAGVRILYFQDMKEFEPRRWKDGSLHGGAAHLAAVLKAQGLVGERTITAFGGELASGSVFGALYKGAPFVDLLNRLHIDVAGFGNHDFDFGAAHTLSLIQQAQFPWLSTNLNNLAGQPFSPDGRSLILHKGKLRIGVIALTGAMDTTNAGDAVTQLDPLDAARAAVQALKAQGVDAVVALSQADRAASLAVA